MPIGQINRHASKLRRNSTEAEQRLWQRLRNRQLGGLKFRRQVTIGAFIADFLCAEKRLIVELDGGQHSPETDAHRTGEREALGYRVNRFWNNEMLGNTDAVLETILGQAQALPSRFKWKEPSSNSG